jgi:hypothetical protein
MVNQYPFAYRLTIDWTKKIINTTLLHRYGGIPSNGIKLPKCNGCHQYHHLLFQIDLRDKNLEYLDLKDQEFLFIISCLNCATYDAPMYYSIKNHKEIEILKEIPHKYVSEYPVPLDDYPVICKMLNKNEYPISEDGIFYKIPKQRGNHQLGGKPLWIQDVEHIKCIRCNNEMSYLAMIDTEYYIDKNGFREKGHMFGDGGILYEFVCRKCNIFSSIAQGF